MNGPRLLTRQQMAEYFQVSTKTVEAWEKEGMPVIRTKAHRGLVRYEPERCLEWLNDRQNPHNYSQNGTEVSR